MSECLNMREYIQTFFTSVVSKAYFCITLSPFVGDENAERSIVMSTFRGYLRC